jgi:hypothetical protein
MSFNWTVLFRRGSWMEFRNFALNQRKNVPSRLQLIQSEIEKIGQIRIVYQRTNPDDITSPLTEKRLGLDISNNTSLSKLLKAYVSLGGNPFDISMFLVPDSYVFIDSPTGEKDENNEIKRISIPTQPYDGIVSPLADDSAGEPNGLSVAGWLPILRYPNWKTGNNESYWDKGVDVYHAIKSSRQWITQEIKERRNDIEARIIKLCDLREQLLLEREEVLLGAVGDVFPSLLFNSDVYSTTHHLSYIVDKIDRVFHPNITSSGEIDFTQPRQPTDKNPPFPTLVEDTEEEKWSAI